MSAAFIQNSRDDTDVKKKENAKFRVIPGKCQTKLNFEKTVSTFVDSELLFYSKTKCQLSAFLTVRKIDTLHEEHHFEDKNLINQQFARN